MLDADKPFSEMTHDELSEWNELLQGQLTYAARKIKSGDYHDQQFLDKEGLERWYNANLKMLKELQRYKK